MSFHTGAISLLSSAVGSSNVLPDFETIKKMLQGSQQTFLDTQGKIIDTQANKAVEQGVSNIIGSGLSGTSVAGGLTAGIQNQATTAKTDLASRTQLGTDRSLLQFLSLLQGASDRSADRMLSADQSRRFAGSGGGGGGARGGGGSFGGGESADRFGNVGTNRLVNTQITPAVPTPGFNNAGERVDDAAQLEGLTIVRPGGSQRSSLDFATRRRNPFYYVDALGRVRTRPRRGVEPLSMGTEEGAKAEAEGRSPARRNIDFGAR